MLTESTENYLKAIYSLESNGIVSTNGLAEKLSLSPSSVSKMIKKLSELGFLEYNPHHGVKLTETGRKESLKVMRRHRLIELFLYKVLEYEWDEIHEEADKLEHYISEKFENALDKYLGYPVKDPHGDPIPGKNGELKTLNLLPMTYPETGTKVKVSRILGNNPEFLKYLSGLGLIPDTEIEILRKEPFAGSIVFGIKNEERMVGLEAAKLILCELI